MALGSMGQLYKIDVQFDSSMFTKRGYPRAMRDLHRRAGKRHIRELFPKHFENRPETYPGAGGYRFKKRTKKWNDHKLRKVGHVTPNVFRGKLKKKVLHQSRNTATANKWSVYAKPGFPIPPWQRREIEVISRRELAENARWMEAEFVRLADDPQWQEHRRKRIRS